MSENTSSGVNNVNSENSNKRGIKLPINKFKSSPREKKPMTVKKAVALTAGAMMGVFSIGCGLYWYSTEYVPPMEIVNFEESGQRPLVDLEKALNSGNMEKVLKIVGEDSWLAQEIEYANGNESRLDFIKLVTSKTKFDFPLVQAHNKRGLMYDKAGNPIQTESDMTDGSKTIVTHLDYSALAVKMQEDSDEILKMLAEKGYKSTDYTYKDEMIDLMIEYIMSLRDLPVTETQVDIPLVNRPIEETVKKGRKERTTTTDNYVIADDVELDKLLFSSDDFHKMCDSFSQVISGWKPTITQQEQDNPEYAKYQRGIADGTISADTPAPDKKIMVNVVVGDSFPSEEIVPYTWIGSYYCQNEYKNGKEVILPQVGNGTIERPAGVGTTLVTKAIGTDGTAHDVKLTLKSAYRDQDAINYLAKFSEQNRGFNTAGNMKLMCFEYTVENLESAPITINSDFFLSDSNADGVSRTGNMFGLTDSATIQPGEVKTMQDWVCSADIEKKYVVWGKSYSRNYPYVWFKLLAGDSDAKTDDAKDKDTKQEDNKDSKNTDDKDSK